MGVVPPPRLPPGTPRHELERERRRLMRYVDTRPPIGWFEIALFVMFFALLAYRW